MLKIYGVPNSQPVRAVVWTCLMKELPFEFVMTSQNRDANQPEFLASVNPRGTIPAIDDDGTVLWESYHLPRRRGARRLAADSCNVPPDLKAGRDFSAL